MRLRNIFEASNSVKVIDRLHAYADAPDVFISFSNVEKLGINPQSEWYDPFAIYAYPVKDIMEQLEQHMYPWAATRPMAYLIRAEGNMVELQDFTTEDLDTALERIISKFRPMLMADDSHEEYFYSILLNWMERWADNPGKALWWVTGRLASYVERHHPQRDSRMVWNSMFRSIGIDSVVDRGQSIINTNEPAQGVFFSRQSFRVIDALYNNLVPRAA